MSQPLTEPATGQPAATDPPATKPPGTDSPATKPPTKVEPPAGSYARTPEPPAGATWTREELEQEAGVRDSDPADVAKLRYEAAGHRLYRRAAEVRATELEKEVIASRADAVLAEMNLPDSFRSALGTGTKEDMKAKGDELKASLVAAGWSTGGNGGNSRGNSGGTGKAPTATAGRGVTLSATTGASGSSPATDSGLTPGRKRALDGLRGLAGGPPIE
jgi:hypothetical protein